MFNKYLMNESAKGSFHRGFSVEYGGECLQGIFRKLTIAANRRFNLSFWFVRKAQARKPVKCSWSQHILWIWHPTDSTVLWPKWFHSATLGLTSSCPSSRTNARLFIFDAWVHMQRWNKQIGLDEKYNVILYSLKIIFYFMAFDAYFLPFSWERKLI